MNKIARFTWDEWKWIAIIVMLGVVMYWTALVIEPTYTLLQEVHQIQDLAIKRADQAETHLKLVIDTMNNNTQTLQTLITGQQYLRDNQVVLVRELGNVTKDLGATSTDIDTNAKVLVLHSASILSTLDSFRQNLTAADKFNTQWEKDDRARSGNIQNNISEIAKSLKLLELLADRGNSLTGIATVNKTTTNHN